MPQVSTWHLRARTLEALAGLILARAAIAAVPLERWHGRLGLAGAGTVPQMAEARQLARHVERAAARLPFEMKCLPRAMALSRMLRKRAIGHRLVVAARPQPARTGNDDLHAWIEVQKSIVIGDLAGPWLVLLTLPQPTS